MLQPKTAFYKPKIPRLEFRIPKVKFPNFFQTNLRNVTKQNFPKAITTELPSTPSSLFSGYNAAEILGEIGEESHGMRMAVSGAVGFLTGGKSGIFEGIIGGMVSNVSDPGRRSLLDEIKPRKTGEIWEEIFSDLPPQTQRWITKEPVRPADSSGTDKYFDDLITRTRTISGIKNEIDKRFQIFLTGDSTQKSAVTPAEIDKSIKRIESMRKLTGGSVSGRGNSLLGIDYSLVSMTPPIKSTDGWLYIENVETLPSIDRMLLRNYSYDNYLEAIA